MVINGVWTGPNELTNIQKLCIRSFQDHGHEFHLWTDQPVRGIPIGTVERQTQEILDPTTTPKFTGTNFFSDYFRAKLIYHIGGWYADLDEVCLKPFDFPKEYVFVNEVWQLDETKMVQNGCIFKASKDCEFLKHIIDSIEAMDTLNPSSWVCMGPELITSSIKKFGFQKYCMPSAIFDPLRPERLGDFITGGQEWDLSQAYALHLRTSYWTTGRLRPNGSYDPDSLFEQLKRKHGVTND